MTKKFLVGGRWRRPTKTNKPRPWSAWKGWSKQIQAALNSYAENARKSRESMEKFNSTVGEGNWALITLKVMGEDR